MFFFRIIIPTTILLLTINVLYAGGKFDMTQQARLAYEKTLALKLDEATAILGQMKKSDPQNLIAHYIESHIECLKVFISEEKSVFNRYEANGEKHLLALKSGDEKSPYRLYTQAQVELFWAMNHAKFGNWIALGNNLSSAYGLLEKNQRLFPQFVANKMSLGVLHCLVGTVPDNYKWVVRFVSGMNGTTAQGMAEIEEVLSYAQKNDFVFEQEALVMYAFLMMHLNNQGEKAWQIVSQSKLKPRENALACFAMANVAMRAGKNDKAIELLQNRPTQGVFPFSYLDYMLGLAKMYRGDADADTYLKKFVLNFKGRNYIKEAYQRLAWLEILRGNKTGYQTYIENCKNYGYADIGNDKNALKEAKSGVAPDVTILRGRLLFDGGYHQKAYDVLKTKKEADFSGATKMEFNYRFGRVLQMLKKNNEAIAHYDKCIQQGKQTKYYYACAAALQMGLMYEEVRMWEKARQFFTFCLSLQPDDYADAFHTKAKSGLNRIKNYK